MEILSIVLILSMVLIISLRLVFKKKKKQVEEEKAIKAPTVVVEKEKNQHKDLTNSTEFFLKNSLGTNWFLSAQMAQI
ncbi:hypothetical protein [Enterococcus sp. N342-3-1-2]